MSRLPILSVDNLSIEIGHQPMAVTAVHEVSFAVNKGETLCIVGESGCGKSLTALAIMQLLPKGIARISSGSISLDGRDLVGQPESELQKVRGGDIGMIFQEPMTSLNPVLTIGEQILETLRVHGSLSKRDMKSRAIELLALVKIPRPEQLFGEYPHRLSGGMRQRVMIAIAIACNPKLLIADEPTTALDVTIQAEVLELLSNLQTELGMGMILITHDLGVVAHMANRVMVMYAGWKVEEAPLRSLYSDPIHPYSSALLASTISFNEENESKRPKKEIKGIVPSLENMPSGCAFEPRCEYASEICTTAVPKSTAISSGREYRCFVREREARS